MKILPQIRPRQIFALEDIKPTINEITYNLLKGQAGMSTYFPKSGIIDKNWFDRNKFTNSKLFSKNSIETTLRIYYNNNQIPSTELNIKVNQILRDIETIKAIIGDNFLIL